MPRPPPSARCLGTPDQPRRPRRIICSDNGTILVRFHPPPASLIVSRAKYADQPVSTPGMLIFGCQVGFQHEREAKTLFRERRQLAGPHEPVPGRHRSRHRPSRGFGCLGRHARGQISPLRVSVGRIPHVMRGGHDKNPTPWKVSGVSCLLFYVGARPRVVCIRPRA